MCAGLGWATSAEGADFYLNLWTIPPHKKKETEMTDGITDYRSQTLDHKSRYDILLEVRTVP